jgi:putative tricarboxylic transport membrane protein
LLILLIYLGGFAVKNSFGDMFLVLLFGALGWLMVKFDWQRPPLLLGLVLGGIAENNLFIASRIYGWSWLLHPGVLVITAIILIGNFYPYVQAYFKRKKARAAEQSTGAPAAEVRTIPIPLSTRIGASAFAFFMMVIMAYVVYEAKYGFGAWEPRAALFPWVIGLPVLLLAIYIFMQDTFRSTRKVKVNEYHFYTEPEVDHAVARQRTLAIMGWIVGFFLAIWALGFVAASAIATLLYLKVGAGERWPVTLAISAACWVFFFGVFDYGLQLPFPTGSLFEWVRIDIPAFAAFF